MTLAHDRRERAAALDLAFHYDDVALVEAYLPARATSRYRSSATTTPGSRSSVRARSSPATSSTTTPPSTRRACPRPSTRAEVPEATRQVIHKIARDAYRAIGAEGFARVDFLVAGDQIYLSEINTIPGFTPISLFPTMPAEGGYSFAAVCARIVDLAIERHAARASRHVTIADLRPGGPCRSMSRCSASRTAHRRVVASARSLTHIEVRSLSCSAPPCAAPPWRAGGTA